MTSVHSIIGLAHSNRSLRRASLKAASAAIAAISLAGSAAATAGTIASDGFGGGPLADLAGSNGGSGWSGAWVDAAGDIPTWVAAPGLAWPGLQTTPGAAISGTSDSVYPLTMYARGFGPLPAGTTQIYVSFLLREDAGWGWGGLRFGAYPYAMTVGVPMGSGVYGLMLSEGLGDFSNAPLVVGETSLVVVRISKNAGAGITYRLYLDPPVGGAEPSWPLCIYSVAPVNALPTSLTLINDGHFTTDEIRVGTTWASVLPAPSCPSDLNGDGIVDGADMALVLGGWGTSSPDLTNDGLVNGADLAQLIGHWGPCP